MIQYKSKMSTFTSILTTDIGAEEVARRTLFRRILGRAIFAKIASCYNKISESDLVMKYPLHTVSKPVSGSEVQKLAHALKSGGYVANEAALALAKRIAARRHRRKAANAAK